MFRHQNTANAAKSERFGTTLTNTDFREHCYLKPYKSLVLPVALCACGTFPLVWRRHEHRALGLRGRNRGHIRGENDVQGDAERQAASHLSVTTICTRASLIALQITLIYIHQCRSKRVM